MYGVYRKEQGGQSYKRCEGHTAAASAKVKRNREHVVFKRKAEAQQWITDNAKGEEMFVRKVSKGVM